MHMRECCLRKLREFGCTNITSTHIHSLKHVHPQNFLTITGAVDLLGSIQIETNEESDSDSDLDVDAQNDTVYPCIHFADTKRMSTSSPLPGRCRRSGR